MLIFIPFEEINNKYIEFNTYNVSVMTKRNEYGKISKYKTVLNEDDVICFVSNIFDNSYAVALSKYEMMPIRIINEEYINDEDFEETIRNKITYIYILNEDKLFENKLNYTLNLNIKFEEDSLYKLNKMEGEITLKRITLD